MKFPFSFCRHALGIALTILALGGAYTANAQIDPYTPATAYEFSTMGVARGQTARLSLYYHNVFPPGPCAPGVACDSSPVGSFQATVSFLECDGSVVAQNTLTLTPDKGGTLVFTPTSFHSDGRACARALVNVAPDANGFLPDLRPSVEVLDAATGKSMLLNPGAAAGFNPQPEPPRGDSDFGLFNVITGQTARVEASFVDAPSGFPPGPCRVTLSFYSGDGQLLSQSIQSLAPGATAQFDYPTTNLPANSRIRIRASVHVESEGGFLPCIMPAVEVFDNTTGKGSIFYPGLMIGSD
jgi:hypothetical protein